MLAALPGLADVIRVGGGDLFIALLLGSGGQAGVLQRAIDLFPQQGIAVGCNGVLVGQQRSLADRVMGQRIVGIVFEPGARGLSLPRYRVQDIDTEDDWLRAEAMARVLPASDRA